MKGHVIGYYTLEQSGYKNVAFGRIWHITRLTESDKAFVAYQMIARSNSFLVLGMFTISKKTVTGRENYVLQNGRRLHMLNNKNIGGGVKESIRIFLPDNNDVIYSTGYCLLILTKKSNYARYLPIAETVLDPVGAKQGLSFNTRPVAWNSHDQILLITFCNFQFKPRQCEIKQIPISRFVPYYWYHGMCKRSIHIEPSTSVLTAGENGTFLSWKSGTYTGYIYIHLPTND
jgi:hypothetical protein